MNILLDKLPTSIIANGEKLKINPDFRVWIEVSYVLDTLTEKITNDILSGVIERIIELAFYEQPKTVNELLFRSIPTCVGKTITARSNGRVVQVHPHVCGENSSLYFFNGTDMPFFNFRDFLSSQLCFLD